MTFWDTIYNKYPTKLNPTTEETNTLPVKVQDLDGATCMSFVLGQVVRVQKGVSLWKDLVQIKVLTDVAGVKKDNKWSLLAMLETTQR